MDRTAQGPRGNVLPIAGWVEPLRCGQCASDGALRIDLVECEHSVRGGRRPGDAVIVDEASARVEQGRVAARFFRCTACDFEWPVQPGTRFTEPGLSGA